MVNKTSYAAVTQEKEHHLQGNIGLDFWKGHIPKICSCQVAPQSSSSPRPMSVGIGKTGSGVLEGYVWVIYYTMGIDGWSTREGELDLTYLINWWRRNWLARQSFIDFPEDVLTGGKGGYPFRLGPSPQSRPLASLVRAESVTLILNPCLNLTDREIKFKIKISAK